MEVRTENPQERSEPSRHIAETPCTEVTTCRGEDVTRRGNGPNESYHQMEDERHRKERRGEKRLMEEDSLIPQQSQRTDQQRSPNTTIQASTTSFDAATTRGNWCRLASTRGRTLEFDSLPWMYSNYKLPEDLAELRRLAVQVSKATPPLFNIPLNERNAAVYLGKASAMQSMDVELLRVIRNMDREETINRGGALISLVSYLS